MQSACERRNKIVKFHETNELFQNILFCLRKRSKQIFVYIKSEAKDMYVVYKYVSAIFLFSYLTSSYIKAEIHSQQSSRCTERKTFSKPFFSD